jgi:hypothetical protein
MVYKYYSSTKIHTGAWHPYFGSYMFHYVPKYNLCQGEISLSFEQVIICPRHLISWYLYQICSKLLRSFSYVFTKLFCSFLSLQNVLKLRGTVPIFLSTVKKRFPRASVNSASNRSVSFCTDS